METKEKWFDVYGSVRVDVDEETFNNEIVKWVESKGWFSALFIKESDED